VLLREEFPRYGDCKEADRSQSMKKTLGFLQAVTVPLDTGGAALRPPLRSSDGSSLYAWTYEHALFAWQHAVRHRAILGQLRYLESTQWLTEETLEDLQVAKLRSLLVEIGAHVPYYRELFEKVRFDPRGVKRRADLAELPALTRDIIRDRYEDLIHPAYRGKNIRKGTSGTTGQPLRFEYSNESESWRQATRIRGYRWAGYQIGRPTLHYWGGASSAKGLTAAKVRVDRALRREVYIDAVKQDEASMRAAVDVVRKMKPHVIVGYTQATAIFARFITEHGLRDWDDIPVICGAEAVLSADRTALVRAFGPVFETYGSRETMLLGSECSAHDGLHLSEENVLVEITRDGIPLGPGDTGEVLVTDLHNVGMPFVRYLNGDLATLGDGRQCRCGRGLRKLARVDGRRSDTLRDRNGAPIPGMMFISHFAFAADLLREFQVVQKKSGEVTLKVVRGQTWSDRAFDDLVARLRGYLQGLPLRVEFCDSIAPTPSGKRRPIVVENGDDGVS
jgi:phenylacetate-CoA ligase